MHKAVRFGFVVVAAMAALAASASEVKWEKKFDAAAAKAKAERKLLMVDFETEWCGWCKELDKKTYPDPRVVALSTKLVPIKVDAEKEGAKLAKKYKVTGYPTILFLDEAGGVVHKIGGYMGPEGFSAEMAKAIKFHEKTPAMKKRLAGDPDDVEALGLLGAAAAARGDINGALAFLARGEKADANNSAGHLTDLYNAVGDHYQLGDQPAKAISYFTKAAKTGKSTTQVAYARISIAYCYLAQDKKAEAKAELQRVLEIKGLSKDDRELAENTLKQLNAGG